MTYTIPACTALIHTPTGLQPAYDPQKDVALQSALAYKRFLRSDTPEAHKLCILQIESDIQIETNRHNAFMTKANQALAYHRAKLSDTPTQETNP